MSSTVPVRLLDLPLLLHDLARRHAEAVRRELRLVEEQGRTRADSVPPGLLELSRRFPRRFEAFPESQEELVETALDEGLDRLPELRFDVGPGAGAAARSMLAALDEVDAWRRADALLVDDPDPQVLDYRRWFLEEFARQCTGDEPRAWPGPWG